MGLLFFSFFNVMEKLAHSRCVELRVSLAILNSPMMMVIPVTLIIFFLGYEYLTIKNLGKSCLPSFHCTIPGCDPGHRPSRVSSRTLYVQRASRGY